MKENGYQATDELTGDISYQYLGFFKSMDGQLADVKSTNDLEIFQEIESNERKERKKVVQRIVAESQVRMLTGVEKQSLGITQTSFLMKSLLKWRLYSPF